MRKIYLSAIALSIASFSFGQRQSSVSKTFELPSIESARTVNDTIISHFAGGTPTLYTASGGGYVTGHNSYMDASKLQLFDADHGVSDFGDITGVLLWFGHVEGNPSSQITVSIHADNGGTPNPLPLGSSTITFQNIDTSGAGLMSIAGGAAAYNAIATFSSPVDIPGDKKFWAGFTVQYIAGDTVGLVNTTEGDFPDADTHTGEVWNDATFHTYGDTTNWGLDIAHAIFPVVDYNAASVNENSEVNVLSIYPNPASTNTSILYSLKNTAEVTLQVTDITGKQIMNINKGTVNAGKNRIDINVENLAEGIYTYTLNAGDFSITKKLVVRK